MSKTPLHTAMQAAGLNDGQLAEKIGWSRAHLCRVRNGAARPTRALALAIVRELPALTVDEVLGQTEKAA
jgi:transcriptional regulator with XRE-family HTH domain